jgi:hypothetical protein
MDQTGAQKPVTELDDDPISLKIARSGAVDPCYKLNIPGASRNPISVYFAKPEQIFKKKVFPFVSIERDDFSPAMQRWMSVGQLEYKVGVSGTQATINGRTGFLMNEIKFQAMPYDFIYTISCFDRYERTVQPILLKLLQQFPPVGKIKVFDSLELERSYECYMEGPVASIHEIVDPTMRVRGYSFTIRVEGQLDLAGPFTTNAVSGVDLRVLRMKKI